MTKSSQAVSRLAARVRQIGAPVIQVDERRLDQIIGEKVVHQGICALLSEIPFVEVEEIAAFGELMDAAAYEAYCKAEQEK